MRISHGHHEEISVPSAENAIIEHPEHREQPGRRMVLLNRYNKRLRKRSEGVLLSSSLEGIQEEGEKKQLSPLLSNIRGCAKA